MKLSVERFYVALNDRIINARNCKCVHITSVDAALWPEIRFLRIRSFLHQCDSKSLNTVVQHCLSVVFALMRSRFHCRATIVSNNRTTYPTVATDKQTCDGHGWVHKVFLGHARANTRDVEGTGHSGTCWGTKANCEKPVRISGLAANVLTWDLRKTNGRCYFYYQGDNASPLGWWRQQAPLKNRQTSTRLHGATTQKTVLYMLAALRTWNLSDQLVKKTLSQESFSHSGSQTHTSFWSRSVSKDGWVKHRMSRGALLPTSPLRWGRPITHTEWSSRH
jgi:hypothetical protein